LTDPGEDKKNIEEIIRPLAKQWINFFAYFVWKPRRRRRRRRKDK
jgi:hypothetical protein